jgi:hypothetical protein
MAEGSLAFFPLGLLVAGPVASVIGTSATLWFGAAWMVASTGAVLLIPDVRNLGQPAAEARPEEPDEPLAAAEV